MTDLLPFFLRIVAEAEHAVSVQSARQQFGEDLHRLPVFLVRHGLPGGVEDDGVFREVGGADAVNDAPDPFDFGFGLLGRPGVGGQALKKFEMGIKTGVRRSD